MNMVLTTIEVKPENMDEFVRIWNEGSMDVKPFKGFKEGYLVTNQPTREFFEISAQI